MKTSASLFSNLTSGLMQLFYPHLCAGCGDEVNSTNFVLCFRCMSALPLTNFHLQPDNLVEKIFWGRLQIGAATSLCYFSKESLVQHILHQFKYRSNRQAAIAMGRMLGQSLRDNPRFAGIDEIIPLPLHPARQRTRGYNQAELIGEGIQEETGWKLSSKVMARNSFTETQTHRNRTERWKNMKDRFVCTDAKAVCGKHFLLVDDLVTTGATLEACGQEILSFENTKISLATIAYAVK